MIRFILNNNDIKTDSGPGGLLLDFIRYNQHLTGTKIGCREGDCGACTILVGELKVGEVVYRSFTSCLTPLGNVHGKHVVTVEGVNMPHAMNPVQQAMADCSATQCGFCTPGFVMSLSGFCLSTQQPNLQNAIASIDGNICRCTGYKSIEKAAARVAGLLQEKPLEAPIAFVTSKEILPAYLLGIRERLKQLSLELNGELKQHNKYGAYLGGGTDLYVQKPEDMIEADIHFMAAKPDLKTIRQEGNRCILGPAVTVSDLQESSLFKAHFPHFEKHVRLVSSTPIRNMATIAGNFINGSPIGDFTIFFLALDAHVVLTHGKETREVPLSELYKAYKILDKKPDEYVFAISFEWPSAGDLFNFEKVSKRTNLDIASVNTAIKIRVKEGVIAGARISAGGVGPTPMYLHATSQWLLGKELTASLVQQAAAIAQSEIAPISDARGTAAYKTLLLGQLIKAHFITLFPGVGVQQVVGARW